MSTTMTPRTDSPTRDGRPIENTLDTDTRSRADEAAPEMSRGVHVMQRVFPTRDLFRRPAIWSPFWGLLSTTAFAGLLCSGLILLHLLETGGTLRLSADQAKLADELTGVEVSAGTFSDLGLRPLVWAARDTIWADTLATFYEQIPLLQSNWTAFVSLIVVAILFAVLWRIFATQARMVAVKTGLDVSNRLRKNLHRQSLRVGPGDLLQSERERISDLFTEDADRTRAAVARRVYTFGIAGTQLLMLVGFALLIDWRAALQCLVPLACCWYLFNKRRQAWRTSRERSREAIAGDLDRLSADFGKSRIICGYGMADIEHRAFQKRLDTYGRDVTASVRRDEMWHWLGWGLGILAAAIGVFFVGIKGLRAADEAGALSFASLIILLSVMCLLYRPVSMFNGMVKDWSAASTSATAIFEYLDRIPDVSQAVGAKFLQPLSTAIQYEQVTFDTPDGRLLDNVDLRLEAGRTYAFVSQNPLEAHALAYLLPRFIEPDSGRVRIDGEDLAWVTLESLRAETTYVGGEAPWFFGTVLDNIRSGDERRSLQDVTEAAKLVHAHKFISKLPRGYETELGDGDVTLSVGDAFRLALARAAMKSPALMIIEEPNVPLDADAKALLDDAYQRICRDRTVIFLPSRLPTVRRADGIVMLAGGKVVAAGNHADLVKSSEIYRHWDYTKFNPYRKTTPVS